MDFKEILIALFASHPTVDEFHFTKDGFAFQQKSDAEGHARSLDEKKILTLNRNQPEVEAILNGDDELKVDEPKADEPKVEEPKIDEPKADEPKVDEPKADTPAAPKAAAKKAAVKK